MKKWTSEEAQILRKAVKDSNDNLILAFQAASQMTGRTPEACSLYWYRHLSKEPESYSLMCYTKKPVQQKAEIPLFGIEAEKPSLWNRFLNLFK